MATPIQSDRPRTGGPTKFVSDLISVVEINVRPIVRYWYLLVLGAVGFPLPIFYVIRAVAPNDPDVIIRMMAGTLVFGVAFTSANMVGQQVSGQRFTGNLKLFVTMPVSKGAYVFGTLLFASMMGAASVVALLGIGMLHGLGMELAWTLVPVLILTILPLVGVTLVAISFAPTHSVGNMLSNVLGIILVIVSPVYFTMEQAPLLLRWLGYISPLRYSADGIAKSLSGQTDVWSELAVLAAVAVVTMALGIRRMQWRES